MQRAMKGWFAGAAAAGCLLVLPGAMAAAQETRRFEEKTAEQLGELGISDSEVQSIRYVLKRKMDKKTGPDIRGAEAYIRLARCSGYLVVDMNNWGYVRQSYTTGDCEVANLSRY